MGGYHKKGEETSMTDTEIDVAMALLHGYDKEDIRVEDPRSIPFYSESLTAMAKVRAKLNDTEQRIYLDMLDELVPHGDALSEEGHVAHTHELFNFVNASAKQHCIAILRATNRWIASFLEKDFIPPAEIQTLLDKIEEHKVLTSHVYVGNYEARKQKVQKMHPQQVKLPACKECGANAVDVNMDACLRCGAKQNPVGREGYCTECSHRAVDEVSTICANCGSQQRITTDDI